MSDCRLYLVTPPDLDPVALAPLLDAALAAGDVACVLYRPPADAPDDAVRAGIAALRPLAQGRDAAFLIADRPALAAATGCDGVHLTGDGPDYPAARKAVGPGAIVGVACGTSRHAAMEAGEAGADYVWFAAETDAGAVEPVGWWAEMMEVPAVAFSDAGPQAPEIAALIGAGADFLALGAGVWRHPDGPAAAVAAFQALLR